MQLLVLQTFLPDENLQLRLCDRGLAINCVFGCFSNFQQIVPQVGEWDKGGWGSEAKVVAIYVEYENDKFHGPQWYDEGN